MPEAARLNIHTVIDTVGPKPAFKQLGELAANELIFAIVGPVGAGTSVIAEQLELVLQNLARPITNTCIIKASSIITNWAKSRGLQIPEKVGLERTTAMQDAGDLFRQKHNDHAAVAIELVKKIRERRAETMNIKIAVGEPIQPDGQPRAFILDSIKHPDEVALLRRVYQDAFCLIGIVCHERQRQIRLLSKYKTAAPEDVVGFMKRDANAPEQHGQKVAEAFHLSDFFVNNTVNRWDKTPGAAPGEQNKNWDVREQLARLADILTHQRLIRPRASETGMFHAYGARMRSSCLSRQVGAALIGKNGDLIATGTNEVPRAGGGTYGPHASGGEDDDPPPHQDHRCFVHNKKCSNIVQQNQIIEELLAEVPAFKSVKYSALLMKQIRNTRIGQLIEFSRAVHAEMDALMSAARSGVSTVGGRLFVTTFPCHSCARHIVTAGIAEVQYIEPYFKSRALELHGDAITDDPSGWFPVTAPGQPVQLVAEAGESTRRELLPRVLFRPFVGVAPRLYRRAFYKDTLLRDENSGDMLPLTGPPDGPATTEVLRVSYAQVEAHLAKRDETPP